MGKLCDLHNLLINFALLLHQLNPNLKPLFPSNRYFFYADALFSKKNIIIKAVPFILHIDLKN